MREKYSYAYRKSKQQNVSSYAELFFYRCVVSCVILLAALILNLVPVMKNFRGIVKSELGKNISVDKIISVGSEKFELIQEKFFASENFQVDQNLIDQIENECETLEQVKKNLAGTI